MADCDSALGCSNISIMQLFHELKQKFPAVPDRVVSECIRQNAHDKDACEAILRRENQGYLLHSYPIALKMSAEPAYQPSSVCDHSLLNNEVGSVPTSVANQQTLSLATNNRPSNFEFLTNVVDNSASGDVTYSQSDRTVSVVTYSNERRPENYEVNVNYSTSPSTRVRSALQLSPIPHYLNNPPPQQARSYTSVNLTLRPPSSEPQPPIDIRSAGSSLTYSTCSYDPRQGFQSQLQIRIGPGSMGSVSAVRTHVPSSPHIHRSPLSLRHHHQLKEEGEEEEAEATELQPHTQVLLLQQLERKSKLQRELNKEKENLRVMQREVQEMKKDLEQRQRHKQTLSLPMVSTVMQRVQELRAEILRLQEECKKMTQEVDLNLDARVPLGETDEEFYKNIYTGQRGFILPPPSQPPPQRPDPGSGPGPGRGVQSGEPTDGPHWTCSQCTFRNHPLLDKCETCEMPRIMLGSNSCYCHPAPFKTCLPNPLTPFPVMHAENSPSAEQA